MLMKRFLPITKELSLIRETHRVLVQYLRLSPGDSLSCAAALSKQDLRRARDLGQVRLSGGAMQDFENDLAQLSWTRSEEAIQLQFLDEGRQLVALHLCGEDLGRWLEAISELTPGS